MGVKISKRYFYKSQPKIFKLVLEFPPNGPHKTTLGIFDILSFWLLMIFVSKISNSPLNAMEKSSKLSGKRAILQSKTEWNLGLVLVGSTSTYTGYLWPCSTQGHLWVVRVTSGRSVFVFFFKNAVSENTASSTNRSQDLSNFPWIIFSVVLTKLQLGFLKFWKLKV